jgi:hypothetical protein
MPLAPPIPIRLAPGPLHPPRMGGFAPDIPTGVSAEGAETRRLWLRLRPSPPALTRVVC